MGGDIFSGGVWGALFRGQGGLGRMHAWRLCAQILLYSIVNAAWHVLHSCTVRELHGMLCIHALYGECHVDVVTVYRS